MYEFIYSLIPVPVISFFMTLIMMPWIIPKLKRAGLVGRDVNKPGRPEVPEMGGFGIVFGFSSGILIAIALSTFFNAFGQDFQLISILAALSTILIMSLIGIFDDLFQIHQSIKAMLPLFAALPLVAVKVGEPFMKIPFIGNLDFGIFYALLLVPIGIAGASNVTNMLAGFNGLEAGMGVVACSALALIAGHTGSIEAMVILLSMVGALLAFLIYNVHPAKVMIGDIGTLSIGAVIASSVIIGNFETAGVIIIIPYALDFIIKAKNRFPSDDWWGEFNNGLLMCKKKPVGLCQTIMRQTGGISEKNLVLTLVFIEMVFGIFAILLFLW